MLMLCFPFVRKTNIKNKMSAKNSNNVGLNFQTYATVYPAM